MPFFDAQYDEDAKTQALKNSPVDVMKSELLGNILQGIPGVSGYPITQGAEQMLQPTPQRAPLLDLPPIAQPRAEEPPPEQAQPTPPLAAPRAKKAATTSAPTTPQMPTAVESKKAPEGKTQAGIPIDEQLANAQKEQKNMMIMQTLLKAANQANTAIAGVKPNQEYLSEYGELIKQPTEALKEQMAVSKEKTQIETSKLAADRLRSEMEDEKARRDPNSLYSQAARNFQTQRMQILSTVDPRFKFNPNSLANLSADQLEKSFGKASPEALAESLVKAQSVRDNRQMMMDMKKDALRQKQVKEMQDDLDPNKARGGNLAKSMAMVNAGDRIDAIFKQFPDYNIPKNQTAELSSALAALINGGSAQSQHQIDSMTPSSLKGNAAAITSWIIGNPVGAQQQAFMKMMHDTALREREVADNQVKTAQIQRLGRHEDLKKTDPEAYYRELQNYGIDPKTIVKGRYVPPKSVMETKETLSPHDEEGIRAVMNANPGASREEVVAELRRAGKIK